MADKTYYITQMLYISIAGGIVAGLLAWAFWTILFLSGIVCPWSWL